VTVLKSPEAPAERRPPDAADAVVTITVQISIAGNELPPAAKRLISDLEALAVPAQAVRESDRARLRLVAPPQKREDQRDVEVRRIGRINAGGPSLYLHTGSRMVFRDGAPVSLTRREFDLFQFLCENPRRVFTRSQLLRLVWGYDMVGTERTVDVHVRRLRVKLGDCASMLSTVRGVGYRLDDEAPVDVVVRED
jgi:two-component system, OmpR family, response regulator